MVHRFGKKIGTTVLPSGKNTLSIQRFEEGIILRKNKKEIELEDYELDRISDSIQRFIEFHKAKIKQDDVPGDKAEW